MQTQPATPTYPEPRFTFYDTVKTPEGDGTVHTVGRRHDGSKVYGVLVPRVGLFSFSGSEMQPIETEYAS